MREIKFRAWDKSEKKMKEVSCIDLVEDGVVGVELIGDTCFEHVMWNYVELMQFTGLHDRNGTEIYEGDIIQMGGCRGFVTFKGGILCVERRIHYNEGKYVPYLDWPAEAFEGCEIIGNIFENPELLEAEE